MVMPLLSQQRPAGSFIKPLAIIARAGEQARALAEALVEAELRVLHLAPGEVAAAVLTSLIQGGVLISDAAARLPVSKDLPLADVVRLVAMLGESGLDVAEMRSVLKTR